METSKNIHTVPMSRRISRAFHFVFDRFTGEPTPASSDHYRPSAQRDVGKSATEAAGVQLVIAGLEQYAPEPLPVIERPDAAQLGRTLRYTQPLEGFGYLERPDVA